MASQLSGAMPAGFRFAGVACGLKPQTAAYGGQALDLALIVSDAPCAVAGVFTQNRFPAAPVLLDRQLLVASSDGYRAIVINAGNANACTGRQGDADARAMAHLVEECLSLPSGTCLTMSTGVIGVPLPMTWVENGIRAAAQALGSERADAETGLTQAARAIMTTDTRPKIASSGVGSTGVLVGIAKGAAMIHPNMATMLAALLTDAAVAPAGLDRMLRQAVSGSFNAISVDGDTSTNDTVLVLANGLAGPVDEEDFQVALTAVCADLAQQIVHDAEGSSKVVTIRVTGAASDTAAHQVARAIATSVLFKTAVYGGDPNWGRVLAAAGRSGAELDPQQVALWFAAHDGVPLQVVAGGTPLVYDETVAAAIFASVDLEVHLDLGQGAGQATMWTSDLTHEYVTLNAHYRT